jgi:hypothetical protein
MNKSILTVGMICLGVWGVVLRSLPLLWKWVNEGEHWTVVVGGVGLVGSLWWTWVCHREQERRMVDVKRYGRRLGH